MEQEQALELLVKSQAEHILRLTEANARQSEQRIPLVMGVFFNRPSFPIFAVKTIYGNNE